MKYQPPYNHHIKIIHLISHTSEKIGHLTIFKQIQDSLKLRKTNRKGTAYKNVYPTNSKSLQINLSVDFLAVIKRYRCL
ncbi:hypothetical protein B9T25_02345 [Acinetobacter sp. ANC 4470]|nr:hypothetical protein B9T25_02345 [Acinetobacter sp. ANC 4470]